MDENGEFSCREVELWCDECCVMVRAWGVGYVHDRTGAGEAVDVVRAWPGRESDAWRLGVEWAVRSNGGCWGAA